MNKKLIYFDHASTSPLSENVLSSINNASLIYWGNISSTHTLGIECSIQLEKIRSNIASKFHTKSENIIFTSGSSESISLVFNQIGDHYKKGELIISKVEHNATFVAANILKRRGWLINKVDVDNTGLIEINNFIEKLSSEVKFVSIIWGQSEIGSLQPVQDIGEICSKNNIIYHIDATQIIGSGLFKWDDLKCDLLSFSAHKFGGPKGIGMLLCNDRSRNIIMNSEISFSHEHSIRQGTQSIPLISGLNTALNNIKNKIYISNNDIFFAKSKSKELRDYLFDLIKNNKNIKITGNIKLRLPNHLSFILFNRDNLPIESYKIINFMSDNNIAISSGSACSNFKENQYSVLNEMNYPKDLIKSNIRVSFSNKNRKDEVDVFNDLILECIERF